jgi:polyhydroxyalkanoate synthesis regulator phasin
MWVKQALHELLTQQVTKAIQTSLEPMKKDVNALASVLQPIKSDIEALRLQVATLTEQMTTGEAALKI